MAMEAFFNHSSTTPRAIMRLFKYLEDRPSFSSPDAIIPTVDLEIRLELIKDICEKYETANIETLHFTKLQLSALLIMPLDTLRLAKQMPSLISTWLPTDLYPRFMMQGKLLDSQAGSGGTSEVSASASVNSSASVHRNAREREKPPYKDAVEEMIQNLTDKQDTIPGFSVFKDSSARELETGETFDILLEKEDAEKMKVVLDVQWAVVRLSAFSGAAGDWELDDTPDGEGGAGGSAVAERVESWIEDLPSSTPH
ncbi:uncharacterized protein TrAFT101_005161 [Trichoderma asperellum]|uniref:uncharacterized protein n=1 Tax=Trichoderma asperellum TaxID=101201 RepID=UPI00332CD26A|nr:hypothetical protein TrAFT101_005161 [Trichoderma asperellum]